MPLSTCRTATSTATRGPCSSSSTTRRGGGRWARSAAPGSRARSVGRTSAPRTCRSTTSSSAGCRCRSRASSSSRTRRRRASSVRPTPTPPSPVWTTDVCGVAGAFGQPDGEQLVRAMVERIAHRGPDAVGVRTALLGETPVQLGHRRLSIIDLSAESDQPFVKDGLWLSYNGELYNYQELRSTLQSEGVRFVTHSDTEVVLEALRRWGVDALPRFRGMYAFALFDERSASLLLARDPLGI